MGAFAKYPWSGFSLYVAPKGRYNNNLHVHEMGHVLGLFHTHAGGDLANGSTCHIAGDLCCDTPAEPRLTGLVNTENCSYIGQEVDQEGDLYEPDVGNHMSYAPRNCRYTFTENQIERMRYFYEYYFAKKRCDKDFEYSDIAFKEIKTSQDLPIAGDEYDLLISMENLGNVSASSMELIVSIDGEEVSSPYVNSVLAGASRTVTILYKESFPTEAGRYEVCVTTSGDSLEINSLNNQYCQDIVIRQAAGIPDIAIQDFYLSYAFAVKNDTNKLTLVIENIGSVRAEQVQGSIIVEGSMQEPFFLPNVEVGETRIHELSAHLTNKDVVDICILLDPAFTEVNLDNNQSCFTTSTEQSLIADMVVDSIWLEPNVDTLETNAQYTIGYNISNHSEGTGVFNSIHLYLENEIRDSIIYPHTFGFGPQTDFMGQMDSWLFLNAPEVELCVEVKTMFDTIPENNTKCLIRPMYFNSSVEAVHTPIQLYPNPIKDYVFIRSSTVLHSFRLFDQYGTEIAPRIVNESEYVQLDMSTLPAGIYFLQIDQAGKSITKKIVKL